jgi:hypothetical protein
MTLDIFPSSWFQNMSGVIRAVKTKRMCRPWGTLVINYRNEQLSFVIKGSRQLLLQAFTFIGVGKVPVLRGASCGKKRKSFFFLFCVGEQIISSESNHFL